MSTATSQGPGLGRWTVRSVAPYPDYFFLPLRTPSFSFFRMALITNETLTPPFPQKSNEPIKFIVALWGVDRKGKKKTNKQNIKNPTQEETRAVRFVRKKKKHNDWNISFRFFLNRKSEKSTNHFDFERKGGFFFFSLPLSLSLSLSILFASLSLVLLLSFFFSSSSSRNSFPPVASSLHLCHGSAYLSGKPSTCCRGLRFIQAASDLFIEILFSLSESLSLSLSLGRQNSQRRQKKSSLEESRRRRSAFPRPARKSL